MKKVSRINSLLLGIILLNICCKKNVLHDRNAETDNTFKEIKNEPIHKTEIIHNSLTGQYILKSCEDSRFSIQINDNKYYKILEKK